MNRNVIIGGSSITDSHPWPTWATWVQQCYSSDNFLNTSIKGAGNEVILMRALQKAKQVSEPIIIVQLTNVDKWDWYIENSDLARSIIHEKHPLQKLESSDGGGFWCTGSHFPTHKQYFQEHYFSLQYQMYRSLQLIHWFQSLCNQRGWQYHLLFDSPILSVTEKQLNTGQLSKQDCLDQNLIDNSLCQQIVDYLDLSEIYCPGLIGYAELNELAWYNQHAKGHPGSLIHYYFTRDIIVPYLDRWLEATCDIVDFLGEAQIMQKLFDQC